MYSVKTAGFEVPYDVWPSWIGLAAIFNPKLGVWICEINLKLRRVVVEGSGWAHSEAETLGSRMHVPRRLADEWLRFEVARASL